MSQDQADKQSIASWNCAETAALYVQFSARHDRYHRANRALVEHARLSSDDSVLDFAAGTGQTAAYALADLGPTGRIVCFEPAAAMRAAGETELADSRVRWVSDLPANIQFDRVFCGAGIWQCDPLDQALADLAERVSPGGALCFNVPSAYLGVPDAPGGGRDPYLIELIAQLADPNRRSRSAPMNLPGIEQMDELLMQTELRPERWTMRLKLTQSAFRDWLKLPMINQPFFEDESVTERVRIIDEAYERVDSTSWRWEGWVGWTAWRDQ